MNRLLPFSIASLAFLAPAICRAAAPAYINTPLTSINGSIWNGPNGSVSGSANGLQSGTSGAIIAKFDPSGPDQGAAGPYEYETRTTYRFTQSGGIYVTYFRATPDAHYNSAGGPSTGSFYAFVVRNPVVQVSGACDTAVEVVKSINGFVTQLSSGSMACWNGMVMRIVVRNHVIYIFKDRWDGCCFYVNDRDLMTGRPGVGVGGTPPGNGITNVEVNYADTTPPPQIPTPGVSAFANTVELQWPGTADGSNGSGLYLYQLWRRNLPSGGLGVSG